MKTIGPSAHHAGRSIAAAVVIDEKNFAKQKGERPDARSGRLLGEQCFEFLVGQGFLF